MSEEAQNGSTSGVSFVQKEVIREETCDFIFLKIYTYFLMACTMPFMALMKLGLFRAL